jgi:copper transport protein
MSGRRWRRVSYAGIAVAVVGLAILAALQSFARGAEAHAALIRSNPANGAELDFNRVPLRATLFFSEGIERDLTKIEVFDSKEQKVDKGDLEFDDNDPAFASVGLQDLSPGLYTIVFDNVSKVDGHPWNGVTQFIVKNQDGSKPADAVFDPYALAGKSSTGLLPKNVDSALKWLAMISVAMVAGSAFFLFAVYKPATSFLEDEQRRTAVEAGENWVVNIGHVMLPVSFIASALLVLITVGRFETDVNIWTYLTEVRAGQYRLLNLVLLVVSLAGTDLLFLSGNRRLRDVGLIALIVAPGVSLATYSLVSHSAAETGKFWSTTSDFVHFAASSAWMGALVMLPAVLRSSGMGLRGAKRYLLQANVFDRFSILAGVSVALILSTGVFNGMVEIPQWNALWDTTYGRVLLVKLGIMMALLAVAGLNALILKPRLVAAIDERFQDVPDDADAPPSRPLARLLRWLPLTVIAEVALIVAVFASVSVLTQTSTANGEIAQKKASQQTQTSFTDTRNAGDLTVNVAFTPNTVGLNEFDLKITNADGTPAAKLPLVRLRFSYIDPANPNVQAGQAEVILNEVDQGEYKGSGSYFSQAGNWEVDVTIRRNGQDDVSRTFVTSVRPTPTKASAGDTGAFDLPFPQTTATWNEVVGVALIILGGLAVVYRKELRTLARESGRVVIGTGAVFIVAGGVLAFGVDTHSRSTNPSASNPVKPTADSIARGRMLFEQNCVVCHGADGRGDGPRAAELNPAPADFRLHVPAHDDPQLFYYISDGFPGSEMPKWKETISEQDRWNLVNFLRSQFSQAPSALAGN